MLFLHSMSIFGFQTSCTLTKCKSIHRPHNSTWQQTNFIHCALFPPFWFPSRCFCCLIVLRTLLLRQFVPKSAPRSLLCLNLASRAQPGSSPALSLDFLCFLSSPFRLFCFSFSFFPLIFHAKYLYKSQLPVEIIYAPIIAPALGCTMGAVAVEAGVSLISKLSGLFCFSLNRDWKLLS